MNRNDFLLEIKESLVEEYSEFEIYQNLVIDIYVELSRVLTAVNVKHFIAYGSLLGLVRDNGMIPWDYDIDIMISYSDLDKVIKALEMLNEEYYYVYSNNISDYPLPVLRVCKKGFTYMSIHVDVFMLIGIPDDEIEQKRFIKQINRICAVRLNKYIGKHETKLNGLKYRLLRAYNYIRRLPYQFYPKYLLEKNEKRLFSKYKFEQSKRCMNISCVYFSRTNYFDKPLFIEVNGVNYSIPELYKDVLREEFGDYSTYQPFEKRYKEYKKLLKLIRINQKYFMEVIEKERDLY